MKTTRIPASSPCSATRAAAAMLLARAQADAPYTYEQVLEIARASRPRRSILDFPEYQVCPDRGDVTTHTGPAPAPAVPDVAALPTRRTRLHTPPGA